MDTVSPQKMRPNKDSKRFVLAFIVLFAGGALAFAAGSEAIIRYVVAPHDEFEVYKTLFRSAQAPVAAFGDSHVANAIESGPQIIGLGYPGETLSLMLFKIGAYAGPARRFVVQLSPEQFAIYRADKQQEEIADDVSGRSEPWLQFMRPHFRRYLLEYWRAILMDPVRCLGTKTSVAATTAAPVSFADLPPAEQRKAAEIRVQLHMPLPPGPTVNRLIGRFLGALDELRARGIEACVVEFPLSSVYRMAAARAPSFAALRQSVRRHLEAKGIRFVDLTDRVEDSYFGDPDHIAPRGRAIVTGLMLDECFRAPSTTARMPE